MTSSPNQVKSAKIGVQISKETGGAYADVQEVIESELARIRDEWAKKTNTNGTIRNTDSLTNSNGHRAK
jgi:hypothetical protein